MLRKGLVITTVILLPVAAVLFFMSIHELFRMKTVTVDPKLKEISGIEFDKYKRLWAINDSGDGPVLYMLNKDGTIEREVTVTNAKNVDWEDMTQNSFGHFFLGDFGNNDNKRRWLTIYKIENPIDIKTDTTEAEIIKFTYPKMGDGKVKPEDKKVIVFVDELSSDVSLEKDDVKEFLENQAAPEGEKIQIPVDSSEKNDSKETEGSVESAEE